MSLASAIIHKRVHQRDEVERKGKWEHVGTSDCSGALKYTKTAWRCSRTPSEQDWGGNNLRSKVKGAPLDNKPKDGHKVTAPSKEEP